MAADALNVVMQLKQETGNLRKLADTINKAELSSDFAASLADVISTLNSVNTELCIGSSAFVQGYDSLIAGAVADFVKISNQLGGEIAELAAMLKQCFDAQRAFMAIAAESKPPKEAVFVELLKPTSDKLSEIQAYREARRPSKSFNHLSAISEGANMLGWVTVPNKPAPYVKDMIGSAQFYTNRVLKEFKEKDATHAEWTKSLVKIIQGLESYVKDHHLTGVSWNRQGKEAVAAPAAGGPPPPPGGGPAPPPPPPVQAPSGPAAPASSGDDAGRAALFAALNKGGEVTSGLKKVTDDMKTHKNPELRKQTPKPVSSSPKPYKAPAAAKPVATAKPVVKKPPRTELIQKRWDVEYHVDNPNVRIDEAEMKQTVYIYKCEKSTIQIPCKVNSITLDGCKKVGVVFESVLGSLDIVNCQSIQVQVTGKAAIVNIDKTDGCMVYLSEESKDAQIISAKSSEMNVNIPKGSDGDYTEYPLPEQFKSVFDGKKMVTECVDSLG